MKFQSRARPSTSYAVSAERPCDWRVFAGYCGYRARCSGPGPKRTSTDRSARRGRAGRAMSRVYLDASAIIYFIADVFLTGDDDLKRCTEVKVEILRA
jgi:hypothetical protein